VNDEARSNAKSTPRDIFSRGRPVSQALECVCHASVAADGPVHGETLLVAVGRGRVVSRQVVHISQGVETVWKWSPGRMMGKER